MKTHLFALGLALIAIALFLSGSGAGTLGAACFVVAAAMSEFKLWKHLFRRSANS